MKIILIVAVLSLTSACKRDAPPVVVRTAPAVKTTTIPPLEPAPPYVPPVSNWSDKAPLGDGPTYTMLRTPDGLRISHREIVFNLPLPALSDCDLPIPDVEPPPDLPINTVLDDPVWLMLDGDHEAASLRLSTRGAVFMVNDGCLRTADLTPHLLGSAPESTDPIFAADSVAPENAADATDLTVQRDGSTTSIERDGVPWIDVRHFPGEVSFNARASGAERWVRFSVNAEKESRDGESATGREHTLAWSIATTGDPVLLLDNDFRYGADGPDHEENRTVASRTHLLDTGTLVARGERLAIDDAMNVGVGRCPEMEGVLAFRHRKESVTWTFVTDAGKQHRIGEATRRATFASGCFDVALSEVARRRRLLADRATKEKVSWKAAPQAPK